MSAEARREWESNGDAPRAVVLDGGAIWASPPTGSRVSSRRVPAAPPPGAEGWLTASLVDPTVAAAFEVREVAQSKRGADEPVPESVELIQIVEDLQRDVVVDE